MMLAILRTAHKADDMLKQKIGRPYNVVLGVGLIMEIVGRIHDLRELPVTSTSIVRTCVTVVFFLLLLLHQIGELSEHRTHAHARQFADPAP